MNSARMRPVSCLMTLLCIVGVVPSAMATPIDILSGPGNGVCEMAAGSSISGDACTVQEIGAHPRWQPANPAAPGYGGVWVSYADTGYDGNTVAPTSSLPIFTIVESFTIGGPGALDFWVWADDTADLYFNRTGDPLTMISPANFVQGTCANGPIGCERDEFYNLSTLLDAGSYDITMAVYQIGTGTSNRSNPFGILYSGRVSVAVPEPATLTLLGIGLFCLAFARRRKPAAATSRY